ncbi:MAG: zinc ABC transporter substrate-binding protein [Planctomycetes bacterium]|nr:zinc ABC transporter substrate-binding protein [Planctomycetota bacterium]
MKTRWWVLLGVFGVLVYGLVPAGCSRSGSGGGPVVLVEVAPLVSLVRPLVADGVEVRSIVPAGSSPHGYQMSPSDARRLRDAAMVVVVGPVLEPSISRAVGRQVERDRVFNIAEALGVEIEEGHHHHHDHHGHDLHDCAGHGTDPHLWLDPVLVDALLGALPSALASRGLAASDAEQRAESLRAEVREVGAAYEARLEPFAGRAIITHHDAFRRIAERYGIVIAQVIRPVASVEPTPGDLSRVRAAVAEYGVGAVFIEPQFPDGLPRRIASRLGLEVHTLDPESSEDWLGMMRANLDALVAGLSAPAPGGASGADQESPDAP